MWHTIRKLVNWRVFSQHRSSIRPDIVAEAEANLLPSLVALWQEIERTTGYRWKSTSYWRKSPSHQWGMSLDIAPDIHPDDADKYAVTNMSDPVLYKRLPLLRALQAVCANYVDPKYDLGIFIEPDHLHLQVFDKEGALPRTRVIRWKQPKPIYSDTLSRMDLPVTEEGYHSKNQ